MSLEVEIKDGSGGATTATVTKLGQVVVAPLAYSVTYYKKLDVVNTAFNLMAPETNRRIVITDIIISADKAVGTNGSLVELYCADSVIETTVEAEILTAQLSAKTNLPLTGLNFIIPSGFWINAKCDDANVHITVAGYYVKNA